jgi:diguanylate cyclase (GGDEF)-like protein
MLRRGENMASGMDRSADLQRFALLDLGKRAASGTFIYILLWIAVGLVSGLQHDHERFLQFNAGLILATAVLRAGIIHQLPNLVRTHFRAARACLIGVILFNALHWGVLTALSIHVKELHINELAMLASACGIAGAGAGTLAIIPALRYLFPPAVLFPTAIAIVLDFNADHALIAVLSCIYVVYVTTASRAVHADYWNALTNRLLLEERAREFEELSITDALTKLRNRLFFDVHYDLEWKRSCRQRQSVAILLIDLDHFKQINDSYGHAFGDLCLQNVAGVVQAEIQRTGDVLARYGGEEFVSMLSNTDDEGACAVAQRLLESVRAIRLFHQGQRVPVTCSIGVATAIPIAPDQGYQLIHKADKALYEAKRQGRDRFYMFKSDESAVFTDTEKN